MSHQAALELRRAKYVTFYADALDTMVALLQRYGIEEGMAIASVNSWLDMHDVIGLLDTVKEKYDD